MVNLTMNVLAFFAHPDDETMLAGGTLALLAQQGVKVHYLSATRGEGGEIGEPPICSIEELGQVREEELACAVNALGGISLDFLGYTDPRVGPDDELYAYSEDLDRVARQVANTIRLVNAEAVFTHGVNGEYGHPAHVLTHRAARKAVESIDGHPPMLYGVSAAFPEHPRPRLTNQDNPAHLIIEIGPAREQKTQAALCHRTQHALFLRRSSREAGRQLSIREVIIPLEGMHRILPPATDGLDDEIARLLQPWVFASPAA
jgi:LmbE family N-acetylglucosaminyl deacetylase